MKKIFGIILAMLMVFSMSTAAFAGTETYVPSVDKGPDYVVTVNIEGPTRETETTDLGTVDYKCYNFIVEVENYTKTAVEATDFDVIVTAYNDELKKEYGVEFDINSLKDEAATAHTGGGKGVYSISAKVNTNVDLWFDISVDNEMPITVKTISADKAEAQFKLVEVIDLPETDEEDDYVEDEDDFVEDDLIDDDLVDDEFIEDEEETGGDSYVDEEIPNTGSTPVAGAVGVLGLGAIAALVIAKKKKSNEENWT
jgi:LPXTG-motif cell wall-anchored protein